MVNFSCALLAEMLAKIVKIVLALIFAPMSAIENNDLHLGSP